MKGNVFIVSAAFMAAMMLSIAVAPAMAAPVKQYHVRVLDVSGSPLVGVWICLDGYNKSGHGGSWCGLRQMSLETRFSPRRVTIR